MTLSETTPNNTAVRGWVLYDGSCGFCTGSVGKMAPVLTRYGFAYEPLQSDWVQALVAEKNLELLDGIKLLTPDYQLYVGAEMFFQLARRIWWAKPVYWARFIPGIPWLAQAVYAQIAKRRYQLSGTCALPHTKH
jgi:predicted DCC family thiol-disulfide oxidoreductase YuxK